MGKVMDFINNFMNGRYGLDIVGIVIIVFSLIFNLLGKLFFPFYIIGLALIGFEIFRILSRNTEARQRENDLLLGLFQGGRSTGRRASRDGYAHFECPNCGQPLRIPEGLGKKVITCPKCENRFVKST